MTRIGVRELRQNASRYLELVKAGEQVEVTERGRLIALLVAPDPARSARDRLLREGRLRAARQPFNLPHRGGAADPQASASRALRELREDRLP
ncbi:MAG: type II toxin-antitoxin system Phd/YefM family antitoxin [Candidatus Dormibacteria bacterium]